MQESEFQFHLGDWVMTPDGIAGVVMKIDHDLITVVLPFPIGFRKYPRKSLIQNKKGD